MIDLIQKYIKKKNKKILQNVLLLGVKIHHLPAGGTAEHQPFKSSCIQFIHYPLLLSHIHAACLHHMSQQNAKILDVKFIFILMKN